MLATEAGWVQSVGDRVGWFGATTRRRLHTTVSLTTLQAKKHLMIRVQQCLGLQGDLIQGCPGKGWSLNCGVLRACISSSHRSELCRLISIDSQQRWKHRPRLADFQWLESRCPVLLWFPVEGHHMIRSWWLLWKWPGAMPSYCHSRSHSRVFSMVHLLNCSCLPGFR